MRTLIAALALALPLVLMGCEQEGPMEETGENIDRSMEQTGEAMRERTEG